MATSVAKSRLLDFTRTQCNLFGTTFNPEKLRLGNKILRQRLKGPALAAYYPRNPLTMRDVLDDMRKIESGFETWDDDEEHRLEGIQIAKFRGKGAPKKKWEANTSKKRGKKK